MKRRKVISGLGTGFLLNLTACIANEGEIKPTTSEEQSNMDDYISPEQEQKTVPDKLQCSNEEFKRHSKMYTNIYWGNYKNFKLRTDNPTFKLGQTLNITFTNTSSQTKETGNKYQYNLEIQTEAGWQDIRGWSDGMEKPYSAEAITHSSGEGFSWEFVLSNDGIIANSANKDSLVVCPDLQPGYYRFAYWGIIGDSAIAVSFNLESNR